MESSKPKKQRKRHYVKALHKIHKEFAMHLSPELRKDIGKRNLEAKTGDTVKVMRGDKSYVGKQGKIVSVTRVKRQVRIEGIVGKKMDGTERLIPFKASNLMLISVDDKDNKRLKGKKITKEKTEKVTKVTKDGE